MERLKEAVFLDRDGTINEGWSEEDDKDHSDSEYITSWDQFEFIPEALEGLKLLAATDYLIFVISNQSGIGKGLVDYSTIDDIFLYMMSEVGEADGRIDDYLFCPHEPDFGCCCRKPEPAMIYSLAREYDIDLKNSWMVGDSHSDMEAGGIAGIKNRIQIIQFDQSCYLATSIAGSLKAAVELILAKS